MLNDPYLAPRDMPTVGRASWLVPARVDRPELLDLGQGMPADVRRSLNDLWRINRYLGGIWAITRYLYPRLRALDQPALCVDLAAGAGQIAGAVAGWARRQGRPVRVVALDLAGRNLAIAREYVGHMPGLDLLQADALALPFAPASVDYFVSSLFLHHLTPEQIIDLLRSAYRAARRGLILSDLTRGWLTLAGFKLVQPVFARSYITRVDGAISARRAYTPAEFRVLARAAGLPQARVEVDLPWRMTMVVDK